MKKYLVVLFAVLLVPSVVIGADCSPSDYTCAEIEALLDEVFADTYGAVAGETWTGTHDFSGADVVLPLTIDLGGATSLEIPNGTNPDVANPGEISHDTDGANETGSEILRGWDGASQFAFARKIECIDISLMEPDGLDAADLIPVWLNTTGMTFTIVEWHAFSDDDNVSFELEEITDRTDFTAITTIDACEVATDGTGVFYASDTTITHATIEHDHLIAIDFDTNDTPDYLKVTICGWYNADVD